MRLAKYIAGTIIGSLMLCVFSFMQKSYIGAPLILSGFIVPFIFGGLFGLTITFMFMRIGRLVEKLKAQNSVLELRIQERTKELNIKNKQLEQISRTDSLTSLANRRHFDHVIAKECARLTREHSALSFSQ